MGPAEQILRAACLAWPNVVQTVALIAPNFVARGVVYSADMQLRKERGVPHLMARGLSEIVDEGDLSDVLTEAICAAEALGL